jgi:hypothetical protein
VALVCATKGSSFTLDRDLEREEGGEMGRSGIFSDEFIAFEDDDEGGGDV